MSGLGTSRDRSREEDLWGFHVNFRDEVPPSREEGQRPSQSCSENPDLWRSFGINPDEEAPSTSGISTSRKRSREEEDEQRPAQRPRRSSEEGLEEEPTPSTSGSSSGTQGGRHWEGIYPWRYSDSDSD